MSTTFLLRQLLEAGETTTPRQNLKTAEGSTISPDTSDGEVKDDTPSVEQKVFLVIGVALATICFSTNIVQVWVFARPSAIRSVKSILLLSQATSGLVASFVPVFPIRVISARGETGYNACYLGHSAVILVALLTSLSTSTLIILHHYLTNNHPRKYSAMANSLIGWSAAVGCVWMQSIAISLLPWGGWNSWLTHDARCHLSTLWPLSFTAFLTFILGVHMATTLLMWAASRASQMKAIAARPPSERNSAVAERGADQEAAPIAPTINTFRNDGRVSTIGWIMTVGCLIPLLSHVLLASSCAASSICLASPHHYHEDEGSLPWSSLLFTAAAIGNPLLYVFSDDQVSSMTLLLLTTICCACRKKKPQHPKQKETNITETNVYINNDTDYLIGDT